MMSVEEMIAAVPDGLQGTALRDALTPIFDAMTLLDPFTRGQAARELKRLSVSKSDALAQVKALEQRKREAAEAAKPRVELLLTTGSDAEIAEAVLDAARENGPALIHAEEEFWRYSDDLWRKVDVKALERIAQSMDGEMTSKEPWKANAPRIKGAIECARAAVDAPEFFEKAPMGISFSNGFLRIAEDGSFAFEAPSIQHRARHALAVEYKAEAGANRWLDYLVQVFRDDPDALDKIRLLQQFVGACLVGIATRYARCVVLVGEGNNGKSVFLDVVREMFPESARAAVPPQKLSSDYHIARLRGKRINIVAETPRTDMEHSEGFKAVISGDTLDAREIYKQVFHVRPKAGHLFACNELPGTGDQTHGFWKRFLLVTFNRIFTTAEEEKGLAGRIVRDELAGVIQWALEGVRDLLKQDNYTVPASVDAAKRAWQEETDQVMRFAEEYIEPAEDFKTGIAGASLYQSYAKWAQDNGHGRPMTNVKFASRLKKLGLGYDQRRTEQGNRWNVKMKLRLVGSVLRPC